MTPADTPTWRPIDTAPEWVEYRGMLQGIIHTLFKEAHPPHFLLRDLASRELVKCICTSQDYDVVYRTLERKDGVVLVSGWIRARRLDRRISELHVERMQATKPLNVQQLKEFFGSAPGWTADMTSDDFIESVRREDGDELLAFILATVNAVGDMISKTEACDAIEREWKKP